VKRLVLAVVAITPFLTTAAPPSIADGDPAPWVVSQPSLADGDPAPWVVSQPSLADGDPAPWVVS